MTDKEVIIDSVNVAGCDRLASGERYGYDDEIENECSLIVCENSPNCLYKQLQRKEQECEDLKRDKKILLQRLTAYEEDADVQYALFSDIDRLEEKVQRLQAENKELKNNLAIANSNHEAAEEENDRYMRALEATKTLIKAAIDPEQTPEMENSLDALYQAIDVINEVLNVN